MDKVEVVEEAIIPMCPHCKKDLAKIVQAKRKVMSIFKVFCCPHCRAVLGLSVS